MASDYRSVLPLVCTKVELSIGWGGLAPPSVAMEHNNLCQPDERVTAQAQPTSLPQIRGTPKLACSTVRCVSALLPVVAHGVGATTFSGLRHMTVKQMRRDAVSIGCDKHNASVSVR